MLLGADFSAVSHDYLRELQQITEQMRESNQNGSSAFFAAMVEDARFQMDAVAGQLRAAADLASHATAAGLQEFAAKRSEQAVDASNHRLHCDPSCESPSWIYRLPARAPVGGLPGGC